MLRRPVVKIMFNKSCALLYYLGFLSFQETETNLREFKKKVRAIKTEGELIIRLQ